MSGKDGKMLKYKNEGYVIDVTLPEECGYEGYSVECRYKYDKSQDRYSLSMWLRREDIDNTFKIDGQEIDTQYISSTRETIKQDICRIVEKASLSGFFDYYIERYEYTCKCFDIGSNIVDKALSNDAE